LRTWGGSRQSTISSLSTSAGGRSRGGAVPAHPATTPLNPITISDRHPIRALAIPCLRFIRGRQLSPEDRPLYQLRLNSPPNNRYAAAYWPKKFKKRFQRRAGGGSLYTKGLRTMVECQLIAGRCGTWIRSWGRR